MTRWSPFLRGEHEFESRASLLLRSEFFFYATVGVWDCACVTALSCGCSKGCALSPFLYYFRIALFSGSKNETLLFQPKSSCKRGLKRRDCFLVVNFVQIQTLPSAWFLTIDTYIKFFSPMAYVCTCKCIYLSMVCQVF